MKIAVIYREVLVYCPKMEGLSQADWQHLSRVLQSLYELHSLDDFPAQSLSILSEIVSAEIFGYTSASFKNTVIPRHYTFPTVEAGIAAESFTTQPQQFLAHPVLTNYIQSLDGQAFAISDFLSEQEFHRRESLYEGFFQHFGLEDQMLIYIEIPSISTTNSFYDKQDVLGLSLGRDRRNFTERDRLILNLLRPHLKQVLQNVAALSQVQQQLVQQGQAMEQVGLIALSVDGDVQWVTQKAGKLLHEYFSNSNLQTSLPDFLRRWVSHQVSALMQSTKIPAPQPPLYLERPGKRLIVRFHYHEAIGRIHLLLEEIQLSCFSIEALEMLGLTKREAEVLFLMAKDQSTEEIAKQLKISKGTVKKHLENVYEKFDVQTRLSAVMYALKHLGIMTL